MASVEKSTVVDLPVNAVYNQWTQFEDFPRFMEGVHEVRQLDDKRLHWRAEVAGKDLEWDAEIVEQTPDRVIAWRSTSGRHHAGRVVFTPEDGTRTRIVLRMEYDPEGVTENLGDWLGLVSGRIEGDLERFKEFVESRGVETGAWRGEIHGGRVERSDRGTTSAQPRAQDRDNDIES
jgi:uncharacterized membrane protein